MFNLDFNISFKISSQKESPPYYDNPRSLVRVISEGDEAEYVDIKIDQQQRTSRIQSFPRLQEGTKEKLLNFSLIGCCTAIILIQIIPSWNSKAEDLWQKVSPLKSTQVSPTQKKSNSSNSLEINPEWKVSYQLGERVGTTNFVLTSDFGERVAPVIGASTYHTGQDFGASTGTPIYVSGKQGQKVNVKCWWDSRGGGNVATLTNLGISEVTAVKYLHMNKPCVSGVYLVGAKVGEVGNTGTSGGSHLHFTQENNNVKVKPYKYLVFQSLTGKNPY